VCVRESKDAIEYEEHDECHCDWESSFYVVEEAEGEDNVDCPPKDEIKRKEICNGEIVDFEERVEFAKYAVRGLSGDFMGHKGKNEFTEWLTRYLEECCAKDEAEKAIENSPPHTCVEEE